VAIDHSSHHDEVDNFDQLSTEQRAAARRTVAHFADDAAECVQFFEMLGISPRQEREEVPEVTRPKLPSTPGARKAQNRPLRRA
jgi:hypothetical protein